MAAQTPGRRPRPELVERDNDRGIRVLIADGDASSRRALRAALGDAGVWVVGQAADESHVVSLVTRVRPDVVLLDAGLPPNGGVAALSALTHVAPRARYVVLGSSTEDETGLVALSQGAAGFLAKRTDPAALARTVKRLTKGEAAISRSMEPRVIKRLRQLSHEQAGLRPVRSPLTTREWEVLDLLAAGASTRTIARELAVATDTVHSHIRHILRKLNAHSRAEAVEIAERARNHASGPI
jgi:DNA-binding NarL/FixJ family response regulator